MPINFNKLVFFDTETTGLKMPYIISIAYIIYIDGKLQKSRYIICNPDYPIDPGASKVNGFYNKDLKDKPLFIDFWEEIYEDFKDAIWVGHNVNYDKKAMIKTCERYNLELPDYKICCTYRNAKKLIDSQNVKNYKLNTLCDYFNIEFHNHHTASFDTVACLKIYNELVKISKGNLIIE